MLKHNLKLFVRNVVKNKTTFFINVVGLGVGIASFLLLAIYVYNDLTYDRFNKNLSNIYRVQEHGEAGTGTVTKGLLLPQLRQEIPEITGGTRIFDWDGHRLSHGDRAFLENLYYVDEGFFSVFSFPFKEGSAENVLKEKYNAVISLPFAIKYFGEAPALGKQLRLGFGDVFLTVGGVVDIPENSSVKFDIVTSYDSGEAISPWIKDVHNWYNTFSITYVVLQDGTSPSQIEHQLDRIAGEHFLPAGGNTTKIKLLPLSEYHATEESNQTFIIVLGIIALGIIGIAMVNFINLTMVSALSRTREMGIKKVHGALKKHIAQHIMVEAYATGLVSLLFGAFLLNSLMLPAFNSLFGTALALGSLGPHVLGALFLGLWILVGSLPSMVPSLVWSQSGLVENLRGKVSPRGKSVFARHSSVIVQFAVAIFLIASTFIIRKQVSYMVAKNPKFDNENVIVAQTDFWQHKDLDVGSERLDVISKELLGSPFVTAVNFTGSIPGDYDENYNTFYPMGKSNLPDISLRKSYVGKDYFKTLGINIISGHGFDKAPTVLKNTVVLNKTAMDLLGYAEAENQILVEGREGGTQYRVVGAVPDFSYQGVQHATEPLAHFFVSQENLMNWDYLTIRTEKRATVQVIDLLKQKWQEAFPGAPLTYFFADEKLNVYYKDYERVNTLISWFSLLAIVLSCMGLFALASYTMAKRVKEIGIRKVNGATMAQILSLLNRDFIKWVALSFVIAVPISWFAMNKWLLGFAHKTAIGWWVFVLSGLIVLCIALLTVSSQAIKAALANPVESLRDE